MSCAYRKSVSIFFRINNNFFLNTKLIIFNNVLCGNLASFLRKTKTNFQKELSRRIYIIITERGVGELLQKKINLLSFSLFLLFKMNITGKSNVFSLKHHIKYLLLPLKLL